ncbi:MAG: DUF1624 domain-containing protein [Candidatus Zixiibacteriota bacterium]|nr:MAG: DUF1624 domain-containing protein [candidate division Zixibacteria bacterium]
MEESRKYRIESIDLLRGVVMILMALDHVRMYFGYGSLFAKPTDLATTTPLLFFTRWITHFCAPVFIFLAGTSAFLYRTRRESTKEVSWFLFTRGMWLVLIELIVVRFGWTFDITYSTIILQVIWAIGMSMIFLSALVFLNKKLIFAVGIIIVIGHNLLDSISAQGTAAMDFVWYSLHQKNFVFLGPDFAVDLHYPLIPWIGVMALGYVFGTLYRKGYSAEKRKRWLLWMGFGAVLLFLVLRAYNVYGDPRPWGPQKSFVFSVMSFMNTVKYPVSLLFLLMTIGPSLIFLALVEDIRNRTSGYLVTIGRVPFFFYVIHIYVIHVLGIFGLIYAGRNWTDYILTARSFMTASPADYGYNLLVVYIVWIIVLILLYPLCKRYNEYKADNRTKRWLSYL